MKKLLVLIMGISLAMALAACGSKNSAEPQSTDTAAASGQKVTLKATDWQFDQKEYRVKKGEPVTITLDNAKGTHGAQIKDFKVSLDNGKKTVTFTPDKTGSFPIICSIMCGQGHASMKSVLIVE
ncbi:cupredoxin domain-containing protein [Paenibacillus sedimenti]|uniref:Cupredoxin domain-containing protein n=1 Tax=Paenibacillus sedimenti TaxID=2770274 RepID=A0A926KLW0_9BACL|nr:cupredoxin domain-containing protein [Paenibacillus sedimenti]MBD0380055.1 cupredoxin domain-containing protein [Paenibacillus sedimenti]